MTKISDTITFLFEEEDIMISASKVKSVIKEMDKKHKSEMEDLHNAHVDFVNKTKENAFIKGTLSLTGRPVVIEMGKDVGFEIDGIKVYTGDEVMLAFNDMTLWGKTGIVTIKNGMPYFISNAECGFMREDLDYKFANHFIHYKDGQEVAKGRKGASGFIVKLESGYNGN